MDSNVASGVGSGDAYVSESRRRRWGPRAEAKLLQPTTSTLSCRSEGDEENAASLSTRAVEPQPPSNTVFTLGGGLVEAQLHKALEVHSIRVLLDLRPSRASAAGGALAKRTIARVCAALHVQHQRVDLPTDSTERHNTLRAALAFSAPPVGLLCVESDPRNGTRHEVSNLLTSLSHNVTHLSAHGTDVFATHHTELFGHQGNMVVWPPPLAAVPDMQVYRWPEFDTRVLISGGRCHVMLPWDTDFVWVPDWLSRSEADDLHRTITERINFQQPMLRFERGLRVVEAQQPRRSAWVCDRFNQPEQLAAATALGRVFEPSVFPAHRFEPWSRDLIARAELNSSSVFNALLLHTYDHGEHSMGFHSDTDFGLGERTVIASFSLGATRTFVIRSQAAWQGQRIELSIPMPHGSFIVMGPGFQARWLHAVLKEPMVTNARLNGTLRFYDLPDGAALCACGASRQPRNALG